MSKQLTLSGISFKLKLYFKNASTLYEKFINMNWSKKHHCFRTKQEFIKNALHEWSKIKHNASAVNEYLSQSESPKKTFKPFFEKRLPETDFHREYDTVLLSTQNPVTRNYCRK